MKNMNKLLLISSIALFLGACSGGQATNSSEESVEEETTEQIQEAGPVEESEKVAESETSIAETVTVDLKNSDGEEVGTATLEEAEEGVSMYIELGGIPEGEYGMHIHEVGMATPPTFEDAGGHFNPTDVEHGVDSETGPHVGDLPNLEVPEDGVVSETFEIPNTTLEEGGENSLHNSGEGTALIIHSGTDDYESQPTGDAGDCMLGGIIIPRNEE